MGRVNGNIQGIKDTLLERIELLYDMRQGQDEFVSREMVAELSQLTGILGREISVYIGRDGRIADVSVGDNAKVSMPNMRLVRNEDRLCGVRCIHTHPNGDGRLSGVDLGTLRSMRLDSMAAIGVREDGEPTSVYAAYLGEADEAGERGVLIYGPMRPYKLPQRLLMKEIYLADDRLKSTTVEAEGSRPERAILVGLENSEPYDTLAELGELARTAGANVVGRFTQKKAGADNATYIGSGKAEELSLKGSELEADLFIFDDELTAVQSRNLEEILGARVIDRTALILDIFAQRATSREGKLQVELAQQKYRLPRLLGQGTVLSRLGGGIGTRGPGEKKLEIDRRRIKRRIFELSEELNEIEKQRSLRRARREKNSTPIVALVGYTNAGKSTLLNAITGADIPANNRLFDTLDTTTRLLTVSDTLDVVISDTVGFIRKLPHQLVEAFKATLEELEYADLLLHVIDSSNLQWRQQADTVDRLIRELGADTIPCIRVYNKSDLSFPGDRAKEEDAVAISAKTGEGIPDLLALIDKKLDKGTKRVTLHLPYDKAGALDSLYREAKVESVEYAATVDVVAVCNPRLLGQLKDYIEGWQPPKEEWE